MVEKMRNFISLLKVQFLSYFGLNKMLHRKKGIRFAGIGGFMLLVLLFGAIIVYLGYTYADMFGELLSLYDRLDELIPMMMGFGFLAGIIFSFYSVFNVLYGYKDYLLLSALPIKSSIIVLSKLVFTTIGDLLFNLLISVPSFFVFVNYGGTLTVNAIVTYALILLFSPLLSLSISIAVGVLVAFISSKFRRKNIVQTILMFLLVIGIFTISFLGSVNEDIILVYQKLYFIFPLVIKSVSNMDYLLIVLAIQIVPAIILTIFVSLTYKTFYNFLTAKRKNKKYKLKTYKNKGSFKALLKRDLGRVFSSATYALNSLMGSILLLLFSAFSVILSTSCSEGIFSEAFFEMVTELVPYGTLIFVFNLLLTPTTSCSISIEGSTFWILRTSPISIEKMFFSKIMTSIILSMPISLISGLIISIMFRFSIVIASLFILSGLIVSFLGGASGLFFNLVSPYMNWDNEAKAVKGGLSTLFEVLFAFALVIGFGLLNYYIELSVVNKLIMLNSILAILCIVFYILVFRFGEKMLMRKNI